jgi:hypothetical protein
MLPVVKIQTDRYVLGSSVKNVAFRNNRAVVNQTPLIDFILANAVKEAKKIEACMNKEKCGFLDATVLLLR